VAEPPRNLYFYIIISGEVSVSFLFFKSPPPPRTREPSSVLVFNCSHICAPGFFFYPLHSPHESRPIGRPFFYQNSFRTGPRLSFGPPCGRNGSDYPRTVPTSRLSRPVTLVVYGYLIPSVSSVGWLSIPYLKSALPRQTPSGPNSPFFPAGLRTPPCHIVHSASRNSPVRLYSLNFPFAEVQGPISLYDFTQVSMFDFTFF